VILGTAGHVDHGKTALVRALTGVDTDRLPEEKRRGITIELGFAPLRLADGSTVGVVDVPGHEAFVRNMLAGATGVDLALLVIAADEGVMPQTREHLAILSLLGVRGGVVAITKRDLVDEDWLTLVHEDIAQLLAGTPLADASIVATSVVTGDGIDELRRALDDAARALPARDAEDLFRFPVDRVFTVRGTGTVVTGTVWSGRLSRDATVRIFPGDRTARVRGIESHGVQVDAAVAGSRAAIALAGVEVSDVPRGSVLTSDPGWSESATLLAEVALLADAPRPLGPRTSVRFHLGTTDVAARVIAPGGAVAPGTRATARLRLEAPVVARGGDRFVLRSASPLATIGGGVISDPMPATRRARPMTARTSSAADRLRDLVRRSGVRGVDTATLPVRLGIPRPVVSGLLAALGSELVQIGGKLHTADTLDTIANALVAEVEAHHARAPLEPGAALQAVRSRVQGDDALIDEALRRAVQAGTLEVAAGVVRRAGWKSVLSDSQREAMTAMARLLEEAGIEPPDVSELERRFGAQSVSLLRNLERQGVVVSVSSDRYYARGSLEELVKKLRTVMTKGREYTPAELREALGISRKYLIPFLEYCDRAHITDRRPTGRVLSTSRIDRTSLPVT